jgi:hypothetical protein
LPIHPYYRKLLLSRPGVTPQEIEEYQDLISEYATNARIPPRSAEEYERVSHRNRRLKELTDKLNPGDDTEQFLLTPSP